MKLTRDCDAVLCALYREYLVRRQHGIPLDSACYFYDDVSIQENFLSHMSLEDVNSICWQLYRKGLLEVHPGDDRANDISITEDGILYMEDRFPSGLKELSDYIIRIAELTFSFAGLLK